MGFLVATGSSLLTAFALHLILWRLHLPQSQIKTLLLLFFLTWCAAVGFAWAGNWDYFALGEGGAFVGFFYYSLLYWAAALCYVITYSAMEGDSPTLSITRHLHRKGFAGISHEELEGFFRQRPFVSARVKALVADNIFIVESGGYRLSPGRYAFFRIILGYRRVVFGPVKSGG